MGKKNKRVTRGAQQRVRFNYLTGQTETVPGTKAGRNRTRLPYGHPLRTHDMPRNRANKKENRDGTTDSSS